MFGCSFICDRQGLVGSWTHRNALLTGILALFVGMDLDVEISISVTLYDKAGCWTGSAGLVRIGHFCDLSNFKVSVVSVEDKGSG